MAKVWMGGVTSFADVFLERIVTLGLKFSQFFVTYICVTRFVGILTHCRLDFVIG